MQIEKAARVAAVVVAIILAVVFIVSIARADYPNGFDKIHEICASSPEIQPGIKGVELMIPDVQNENNLGGHILLLAGEADNGIGVGIAIIDKDNEPILYTAIYHMTDESTFVVNIMTGRRDTISEKTVQEFIAQWLILYNKAIGTPA